MGHNTFFFHLKFIFSFSKSINFSFLRNKIEKNLNKKIDETERERKTHLVEFSLARV